MNTYELPLALGMQGGSEWFVILFIVLLLFGAKRLPEMARSLGKGISEFKKAMNEATREIDNVKDDIKTASNAEPEPKKIEPPKDEPTKT